MSTTEVARRPQRARSGSWSFGLQLGAAVVGIFALWELVTRTGILDIRLFSSPLLVWQTALELNEKGRIWPHVWTTTQELGVAFVIFTIVGGLGGVILGLRRDTFEVFYGPIATFFAFPKVTLYPLIIVALGLGFTSKVAFGALFGFFPLIMNTMVGVRAVRQLHVELFDSIGASFWFQLRRLFIPATLPYFITGLRVGFVYAGIGILLAEMFAAVKGLGNRIIAAGYQSTLHELWVYVGASALLLMIGAGALRLIEIRLGRWRVS